MILGTSKVWSKSGPVDLPIITKLPQQIQEQYGIILKHIIVSYLNFLELRQILKFGPTEPHFVCFLFVGGIPPPKKTWYLLA